MKIIPETAIITISIDIEIIPVLTCLNFLRRILTTMSVPPVELPILKIMPMPRPNSTPPITEAINKSFVRGKTSFKTYCHKSIISEDTTVEYIVEIMNFLPKNTAPSIISGTLMKIISMPVFSHLLGPIR